MNKITDYIKNHKAVVILAVLWVLGVIFGFSNKTTEPVGGFLLLVALIATIVVGVKSSKKKNPSAATYNSPAPGGAYSRAALPTMPEVISENGKTYKRAYNYQRVEIYGVEYCSNIQLTPGEWLLVLPEPTNQSDPEAVVILAVRGEQTYKVGYLPRDNRLKHMVNDYYKRDDRVKAFVDNPKNYTMSIAFYKKG